MKLLLANSVKEWNPNGQSKQHITEPEDSDGCLVADDRGGHSGDDRLRTIAGMLLPAILIIIGGILVERAKSYRDASSKAMAAVVLAIACVALLKTMDAPDALVANATLYSAWSIIQHLIVILITIVWLGLMLLTIRYETNRQGGVVIDEDDEDDE